MNPSPTPFRTKPRLWYVRSLLALFLALPLPGAADEATLRTYTYKTLAPQANDLRADVHCLVGDAVPPVIIFIHGRALMIGDPEMTPTPGSLLATMPNASYALGSIDYS